MKTTLITGASGGIGQAFAERLAAEKHNLFLTARSEEKLAQLCALLKQKHGIEADYLALDLAEAAAPQRIFAATESRGCEIEWLINNAGFGSMGDFAGLDFDKEIGMIRLNIEALVALTHLYLQKMRARKSGVIINVSSTASFQPIPFMATYAATKAFVSSFSEALAEENRPHGITITALCPGPTDTNFFAAADAQPLQVKGMQTSAEVVEVALTAVSAKKSKVISGWTNRLGAFFGTLTPNFLVTKAVGSVLRPKIEGRDTKSSSR